jgi:hypothetical protein
MSPAYEGWERNADGSYNLIFGYLNRNFEEEIDVPVGPENNIEPGGPDLGQPTHFLPRRNFFVFKVHVPKDFGDRELVWTLTSHGQTQRAYGTLKAGYFLDDGVIASNFGSNEHPNPFQKGEPNKPPVLTLESETTFITHVGQPITLVAVANDDGRPRARDLPPSNPEIPTGNNNPSAQGLRVAWFVYRGAGSVTFDPSQFKVYVDLRGGSPWAPGWRTPPIPPGNRWIVHATFNSAGNYVLRCLAHDGALQTYQDVNVTVR